jgi:hypothetical protein
MRRDCSFLAKMTASAITAFFANLPRFLRSRSLIVLNDTRVIPAQALRPRSRRAVASRSFWSKPGARRAGRQPRRRSRASPAKGSAGGYANPSRVPIRGWKTWRVLVRGLGHSPVGTRLELRGSLRRRGVRARRARVAVLRFSGAGQGGLLAASRGPRRDPLPPYIEAARRKTADPRRLTIASATRRCSRARPALWRPRRLVCISPTSCWPAWNPDGHEVARITLHVGPGTFRPVTTGDPSQHHLDAERFEVSASCRGQHSAGAGRGAAHRCGRHDRGANPGNPGSPRGPIAAATAATDLLILPGDEFPRRDRPHHQLPPAEVVVAHAGVGLRWVASACFPPIATPSSVAIVSTATATPCSFAQEATFP